MEQVTSNKEDSDSKSEKIEFLMIERFCSGITNAHLSSDALHLSSDDDIIFFRQSCATTGKVFLIHLVHFWLWLPALFDLSDK